MPHRRYRLDIYQRGVTSTTGTITKTFSSSEINIAPSGIGGTILRLDTCAVESEPWTIRVVDRNSTMTGLLGDTNGRMQLLGRLTRIRQSLNSTASTAYSAVAVGRLTDFALGSDIATYDLTVNDERWIEREADVFTKVGDSCWLLPGGPNAGFRGNGVESAGAGETILFPVGRDPVQPARWRVVAKGGVPSSQVTLEWADGRNFPTSNSVFASERALYDWLGRDDDPAKPGTAYRTAVWRQNGTTANRTLWRFGQQAGGQSRIKVFWSTASQPAVDAIVYGYLYAPTAEPSEELPLLIGGMTGTHPFTVLQNVYNGTYSASTVFLPRASTSAIATLVADTAYGIAWFRIPAKEKMADFVDRLLYAPYNVVPVVDSSGRVSPTALVPPTTAQITASQTIASSNAWSPPTFVHPSREIRNVVVYHQAHYNRNTQTHGVDELRTTQITHTYTHDNTSQIGRRELPVNISQVDMLYWATTGDFPLATQVVRNHLDTLARQKLRLLGDGPVYADVETSSAITTLPGQWVRLKLGIYPNRDTNTRTSSFSRICLALGRTETPVGRRYRLLDFGASTDTPLATPTLSLALISGSSRHGIRASLGTLAAGARWSLQYGTGATTASTAAQNYRTLFTGNTTRQDGYIFPSKSKVFGRLNQSAPGRVNSAFSAIANVVTAAITAPSGFAVSGVSKTVATGKWTNGSTLYGTQFLLSASSTATLGLADRYATVAPGSTRLTVKYLTPGDGYKVAVRHFDAFGGFSAQDTTTFTTTTGTTTLPNLRGLWVEYGVGTTQ